MCLGVQGAACRLNAWADCNSARSTDRFKHPLVPALSYRCRDTHAHQMSRVYFYPDPYDFSVPLQELKKHLIQIISRVQGLQAIVFTDRDGVPLIKAATDGAPEHALRPGFLATVGMAMSQGNKLGLGKCNKMISSYGNYQVVSFNRHPVTITLVASSSANTGMILNLEEELNTVSQTLRSVVEAS